MPLVTENYRFDHFGSGGEYSASSDKNRFLTLDYNFESYVGVIGVGVIDGWVIEESSGLEIKITPGSGVIDGFYSESPYQVKRRSEMVIGEREVEVVKKQDAPEPDMTDEEADSYILVIQDYDPSFNPEKPIENAFVKVSIPIELSLLDDEDNYIWATRKFTNFYPSLSDYPPYVISEPSPDDYDNFDDYSLAYDAYQLQMDAIYSYHFTDSEDNHFTTASFNVGSSFSPSFDKVLLGMVTTRSGSVSSISVDNVQRLKNLESTIKNYAKSIIPKHKHGGSAPYDPARVNLETDFRTASLISYSENNQRGVFSVLESQLTSNVEGHKHTIFVDENGDGQTIDTIGEYEPHFHKIVGNIMQEPENSLSEIEDHVHEMPSLSNFTWDEESQYVVYIDDSPVGDNNTEEISVDPIEKTISLSGIIGFTNKTYRVEFDFNGTNFSFSDSQSTSYRFMQNAIKSFNETFPNTSIEENPFVFFDEETNTVAGFDDLKNQCLAADSAMNKTGDSFLLTPNAARDIEILLLNYEKVEGVESSKVTIEILGNSEVTGVLRDENIIYLNAAKIASGLFLPERIPLISHVGRIGETFFSNEYQLISYNGAELIVTPSFTSFDIDHYHNIIIGSEESGRTASTYIEEEPVFYAQGQDGGGYLISHIHNISNGEVKESSSEGLTSWQNDIKGEEVLSSTHSHDIVYPVIGDSKVIYSVFEDKSQNLFVGTSDNFIMLPHSPSYVFVINGLRYYGFGDSLLEVFESVKSEYEIQTERVLDISNDFYQAQISEAEEDLVATGDSYLITGRSTISSTIDKIMIQKIDFIPVPNYKSSSIKGFNNIEENDTITDVELINVQSGAILDPNSEEVKDLIEQDSGAVRIVARVDSSLAETPVRSIRIRPTVINGLESELIVNLAGDIIATNTDIQSNFYSNWSSPETPNSVTSFFAAEYDEEGSVWIASDAGVYVLRSHNQYNIVSSTSIPGESRVINDIDLVDSNNVFCSSLDGIYKTEDQGKTWLKKADGDFYKIKKDLSNVGVSESNGHTHAISVNVDGDGTLEEEDGHTHEIQSWIVIEEDGHTHELVFNFYALSEDNIFYSSDSGDNWGFFANLPSGENGDFFIFEGVVYIAKPDGLYAYYSEWDRVSSVVPYSFQFSYELDKFYIGSINSLHSFDGVEFSEVIALPGRGLTSLSSDGEKINFGYNYSNRYQIFYMSGFEPSNRNVSSEIDFSSWTAERGGWETGVPYDLYMEDKLVISTQNDVDYRDERGYKFTVFPERGVIDFSSKSSLVDELGFYDNFIEVEDASGFSVGDRILIKSEKQKERDFEAITDFSSAERALERSQENSTVSNSYIYSQIAGLSGNTMTLLDRSTINIGLPASVTKINELDSNSEIKIDIYQSPLLNSGINTHQEIEDRLSYQSDQRPYDFNNSYLSNILQLTQAVRYIYPDINSRFINSFFYDFHYSEDPSDENYFEKFIDQKSSESYGLVNFKSDFTDTRASSVNKILLGDGVFSDKVIIGTDVGIFWANLDDSLAGNWFYVFGIEENVFDLRMFNGEYLFIATSGGLYVTSDMLSFELQDQEVANSPSFSLSLRWPGQDFLTIPYHQAEFENTKDESGSVIRSEIRPIGETYEGIIQGRAITITTLDESNAKNKTSYVVQRAFDDRLEVSPPFNIDFESLEVEVTMGAWWQKFSGEENLGNENITNTIVVGGENKIFYSQYLDRFNWNYSVFESQITNFNVVNFLPLSSGTMLSIANGSNKDDPTNYILKATDYGKYWSIQNKFETITGKVVSSTITEFGHSSLTVEYTQPEDFRYSDGELDRRTMSVYSNGNFLTSGKIISNNGFNSSINIFGKRASDEINTQLGLGNGVTLAVNPVINKVMREFGDNVLFGSEIGLYEDKSTSTNLFPIYGEVDSVGYPGLATNIDLSGQIKNFRIDGDNGLVVFSIETGDNVTRDQFKGALIYVTELEEMATFTVVSNSEKDPSGELSVEIDSVFNSDFSQYVGKKIKLVGENSFIDIDFDLPVSDNQLSGGTLTVSSTERDNYGKIYSIIANSEGRIIVSGRIVPFDFSNPDISNDDIAPGQSFICLDKTGKVELNVRFFSSVEDNNLIDFDFAITSGDSPYLGLSGFKVYQNSKNQILLNNFQELIGSSPIATSIRPNDTFRALGQVYQPLPSFSNKVSSKDLDHYHDLNLISSSINGSVSSFLQTEGLAIEFEVANSPSFDSETVQKDGSLFNGARIRFYNPQNIGVEYFSEVIEHSESTIVVKNLIRSHWDFDTYSDIYISEGWSWELYSKNYGYTSSISYKDFIISSHKPLGDIASGQEEIELDSSDGINPGDKIRIVSSKNEEVSFVDSVIDSNNIKILVPTKSSFFVEDDLFVKVISDNFSNYHEHMVRDNNIENIYVEDYLNAGMASFHSHRSLPFVENVSDIEVVSGKIIVSGSGSSIYESQNGGSSWMKTVDLEDFSEGVGGITGVSEISIISDQIVAGTTDGRVLSNKLKSANIIPLEKPEI